MQKRRLGKSGLVVSEICLGTMTMGAQMDRPQSLQMLDTARDHGVNFIDTAEIYPIPPRHEWVHRTEEIVGEWLQQQDRSRVILASKVAGPAHGWFDPPVRGGTAALDRYHIRQAVEGSLKRLRTDYIDLYQVHWPDHDYGYERLLADLTELQQEGKIRVVGSSNESAWGVMKANQVAEQLGTVRFESVQNNFSINNRRFEDALADICRREQISLLPYSPLAGGVLSGKYNEQQQPAGARFTEYLQSDGERQRVMAQRFVNPKSTATAAAISELAQQHGLHPVTLALAWSKQHDYVASTIVGANSLEQLAPSLAAAGCTLSQEILDAVDAISERFLYPMG